jgi:peptidoglycan/xylan/chitin deacetylase (PgdA/CDA1 family)
MVEIIMYHYIRDLKSSKFPRIKGLDIKDFKTQVDYLEKNYRIISIEDLILEQYKKEEKNILLTFDDGYVDHYEYVFELLNKKKIKGAFYTPVDTTKGISVLDVNKIHHILASSNEDLVLKRLLFHLKKDSDIIYLNVIKNIDTKSRFDTEKTIIIKRLLQTALPRKLRSTLCNILLEEFVEMNELELAKILYMNEENIQEMIKEGMHFGSHAKTHPWLSTLNKVEQTEEIKHSVNFLKSLYKSDFFLTICYPYGDYDNNTLDILRENNFKAGFTTKPKVYNNQVFSNLEIPRFDTNDYYPIK